MKDAALVKLDSASHALAECKTVMEAKRIADIAEAARVYLERTNASLVTVNRAMEIRLLAERQMGEFLKEMPKAKGGANYHDEGSARTPVNCDPSPTVITRGEIGVKHHEARRAQQLAEVPTPEFHQRLEDAKASGERLTRRAVIRAQRVRTVFTLVAWQRQARSVMTSWLQAVPDNQRANAVEFLTALPSQILQKL